MVRTNRGRGWLGRNATSFEANFYWPDWIEAFSITEPMHLFKQYEDTLTISTGPGRDVIGFLAYKRFLSIGKLMFNRCHFMIICVLQIDKLHIIAIGPELLHSLC